MPVAVFTFLSQTIVFNVVFTLFVALQVAMSLCKLDNFSLYLLGDELAARSRA